jgi:chorismate dehydratase
MASLWNQYTGLGFVFAMWMVREQALQHARSVDFRRVCEEGLARVEEIAKEYESVLGLPSAELQHYLRENISFRMDDGMRSGLQLYFELAFKHKLITAVKPLKTL